MDGEVVGGIFIDARKMTHKGFSFIDSLQFLIEQKKFPPGSDDGLIAIRQKRRDEHSKAVQEIIEKSMDAAKKVSRRNKRQLEEAADALLNKRAVEDPLTASVPRRPS